MEPPKPSLLLEFRKRGNNQVHRIYFVRGRTLRWILEANPEMCQLLSGQPSFQCRSGLKTKTVKRGYRPKNCDVIYYH